jgi:hypothetical protein
MRVLILLVIGLLYASAAQAQPNYGKPVYDPVSKSYFELVKVTSQMSPGLAIPNILADRAEVQAKGRVYKGVHGRLAIIRSQETHSFIMQNLRPNEPAWIGLRYLCNTRELRWSNGQKWAKGDFSAWANPWNRSGIPTCVKDGANTDWMPIAYSPVRDGFQWFANGGRKAYVAFIVEYPTGHE